jgi:hypothetical protein
LKTDVFACVGNLRLVIEFDILVDFGSFGGFCEDCIFAW